MASGSNMLVHHMVGGYSQYPQETELLCSLLV